MDSLFCALKLKFWDVEISIVSCVITRSFNPLSLDLFQRLSGHGLLTVVSLMIDRSKEMI